MVRQCPKKSASDYAAGAKRKGIDGELWVVAVRQGASGKSKYWRRTKLVAKSPKKSPKRKSPKKEVEMVCSGGKCYIKGKSPKKSPKKHTRISPSESATQFKIGFQMIGNNGEWWVVKATSNGVKRWVRV
jgi:hypothetical protein